MRPVRHRPLPTLLCLLMLCAGGQAFAQTRMSADGGGNCPDSSANCERLEESEGDAIAVANRRSQKAKPVAGAPRGGTRPAAPRWHSFLPGMFR